MGNMRPDFGERRCGTTVSVTSCTEQVLVDVFATANLTRPVSTNPPCGGGDEGQQFQIRRAPEG